MSSELQGRTVAFLVNNSGVEQVELTTPWQAVEDAGGTPVLIAPDAGEVQAFDDDVEKADTFLVNVTVTDASAAQLDPLRPAPAGTPSRSRGCGIPSASVLTAVARAEAASPVMTTRSHRLTLRPHR